MKAYTFDAPEAEPKLTVSIAPKAGGVSAYLFKESDGDRVENAVNAEREPPAKLLLAGKKSEDAAKTYTLKATIPAKTSYTLLLKVVAKETDAWIKVVGR
jgi:hypothetical protein